MKSQAKRYADKKRYVKTPSIQVGDAVLVRNGKKESWSRSMILGHIQWLRKKGRLSQPPETIQDT